jgi:hypothetical protein
LLEVFGRSDHGLGPQFVNRAALSIKGLCRADQERVTFLGLICASAQLLGECE